VTLATLLYLLGFYWPYLAAAAAMGLVVGWRSFAPKDR
jgi:cytochrome c biogenesis protein CcdA